MSEVNSKSAASTTARKRLAPPIAAVFAVLGDEHHRYRVTGYYKRVERPQNMTWIDDRNARQAPSLQGREG